MELKFTQITAATEILPTGGSNVFLYALDEYGQLWQCMRGKWAKMKHPTGNELK